MITNLLVEVYCHSNRQPQIQSHRRPCHIQFRQLCILLATVNLFQIYYYIVLQLTFRFTRKRVVICDFYGFESVSDWIQNLVENVMKFFLAIRHRILNQNCR